MRCVRKAKAGRNNQLAQSSKVQGTDNLREELLTALEDNDNAAWFEYEEDKMDSQRESELIQKYLHEHGEMPAGEGDDLF